MKGYQAYFDRQAVSPALHHRLLELTADTAPRKKRTGVIYMTFGTLAACAALILGLGSGWLGTNPGLGPVAVLPTVEHSPAPTAQSALIPDGGKLPAPHALNINYTDLTQEPQLAADLAWPQGSFSVKLTNAQIQSLLWGPQGRPTGLNPKVAPGDFPFVLRWDSYTVTGSAIYDGEGALCMLTLQGEDGKNSFTLNLCPGRIPPTCLVDPDRAGVEVDGVPVTAWFRCYDRNGDKEDDYICGSEFMAGDLGLRFQNTGAPFASEYNGQSDMAAGGAMEFNALFVTYALKGGLSPDELLAYEDIPAWREERFDTLADARGEAAFAPYLPSAAPGGYGNFSGHLSYQEGRRNDLWVHWIKNYDNVQVEVHLPEGESTQYLIDGLVDVAVPESYDTRLYSIPWGESVPEEYRLHFYSPTFRAEDISLEVIRARMSPHDTGGESCHFSVLHENGVVVSYSCDALSPEAVWRMVEATLA